MGQVKYGSRQNGELTAKAWGDKGYKPKEGAQGIMRWLGFYALPCYTESDVEYVGIDAVQAARRAHKNELARARRKAKKEYEEMMAPIWKHASESHTTYQWLNIYGRIPNADATWVQGEKICRQSERHYYCHISDTHEPSSPEELEEIIRQEQIAYAANYDAYVGKPMSY